MDGCVGERDWDSQSSIIWVKYSFHSSELACLFRFSLEGDVHALVRGYFWVQIYEGVPW